MQQERWNPDQYNRFRGERMQPFFDLVSHIRPSPGLRAIDLGCGTGELTALLAERLDGSTVEGVDASASMLEQAKAFAGDRVSFRQQDIRGIDDYSGYDLLFSHAALQWLPDNPGLVGQMLAQLRPGGQIAVQVPKNEGHPSHRLAIELAQESPFKEKLGGFERWSHALPAERYAELLYANGLREQVAYEKIYGHELAHSADVVEWVKGTSLNSYLSRLNEQDGAAFVAEYRRRLLAEIGEHAPYFYPFRRVLFWGQKPE